MEHEIKLQCFHILNVGLNIYSRIKNGGFNYILIKTTSD